MCVCESDLIKMKLHLITRRYYPGIKYNEAVLGQFAEDLGFATEREVRGLPEPEQAELAGRLYNRLVETGSATAGQPSVRSPRRETTPI